MGLGLDRILRIIKILLLLILGSPNFYPTFTIKKPSLVSRVSEMKELPLRYLVSSSIKTSRTTRMQDADADAQMQKKHHHQGPVPKVVPCLMWDFWYDGRRNENFGPKDTGNFVTRI